MMVFLVADQRQVESLTNAVAEHLAWQQLDSEKVHPLNLDPLNQKQVEDRVKDSSARLAGALRETYKLALVPVQNSPTDQVSFETVRCDGSDGLAERCSKKLVSSGMVSTAYSSEMLRGYLDGVLAPVWEAGHCTIKDLWDVLSRYTYLPRMVSIETLINVATEGAGKLYWVDETWGLAADIKADGNYVDLIGGGTSLGVNSSWLIVKPKIAFEQIQKREQERNPEIPPVVPGTPGGEQTTTKPDVEAPQLKPLLRRFWGSKKLNAASAKLVRDFEQLQNEVIAHLQRELGSEVTITVQIEVQNDSGFSEKTVRDVTANADTLKFDDHGFA